MDTMLTKYEEVMIFHYLRSELNFTQPIWEALSYIDRSELLLYAAREIKLRGRNTI